MADLDTPRMQSDGDITEQNSLHVSENFREGNESPKLLIEKDQSNQNQQQGNQQEGNFKDPINEALSQLQDNSAVQQFEIQKQIQIAKLRYIIPNHVDQTVMRISNLKNIYEFQGIQSERWNYLNNDFSHFREIRDDGNQQFRAVGLAILESFIRAPDNYNLDTLNDNFKSNQHQFEYNKLYQDFRNK